MKFDVRALPETDSTQSELIRLAKAGAPEGTVVIARHQRAGRGRRGHVWWDEPGSSLLVSVLLRPSGPPAPAPQLSLLGGLAVAEALEGAVGVPARIRWPNDILVDDRKLGGILAEASSAASGRLEHVILGIGVNLNQTEFPDELRDRATSLRLLTGRRHAPDDVLAPILDTFDRRYGAWRAGGFGALREAWWRRAMRPGPPVRLPDGRLAVAVDVDDDGALLVRVGEGPLVRVLSGEPVEEGAPRAPRH